MLTNLPISKRRIIIAALLVWATVSVWAMATGRADIFAAMGSFSLCISFAVFLTDRYVTQESRRHWDSEILTQSRMMWRYYQDIEHGQAINDPTPLVKLRDQVSSNFDDLLAAKAAERRLEHFRLELFFTAMGTLQWGFGGMFMKLIYGA